MAVDTETFEDYGEQGPDTDGLAAAQAMEAVMQDPAARARLVETAMRYPAAKYLVSDGHEVPRPDWLEDVQRTAYREMATRAKTQSADHWIDQLNKRAAEVATRGQRIAELEARIANRDKTIDTLMAQIAGLRTEAQRLSELAQQLSARHGAAGEPQTGASTPCETPRANPFAHGWATNWRMR